MINKFFCEVGEKLARKIPNTGDCTNLPETGSEFVWCSCISVDEVTRKIEELNIVKSCGIPVLGSKLLKECLRCNAYLFT